jgi:uncharacterized protein (DUF952 family)
MPVPSPLPTYLYKILPSAPPSPLPSVLPLSDLDRNDGYIHLSTSTQVPGTCDKFFNKFDELYLLRIKYETLEKGTDADGAEGKGEVKWEDVEGGRGCFAHYYGAGLGKRNVESVMRVKRDAGWEGLKLEW